jgi:hypothetical protein
VLGENREPQHVDAEAAGQNPQPFVERWLPSCVRVIRNPRRRTMESEQAEGLMRFFSSQVEVMLAQYQNINDLLGKTTHHTHPGTHCEILLRKWLWSFLPPGWSADKGYIYGRVKNGRRKCTRRATRRKSWKRPLVRSAPPEFWEGLGK